MAVAVGPSDPLPNSGISQEKSVLQPVAVQRLWGRCRPLAGTGLRKCPSPGYHLPTNRGTRENLPNGIIIRCWWSF